MIAGRSGDSPPLLLANEAVSCYSFVLLAKKGLLRPRGSSTERRMASWVRRSSAPRFFTSATPSKVSWSLADV